MKKFLSALFLGLFVFAAVPVMAEEAAAGSDASAPAAKPVKHKKAKKAKKAHKKHKKAKAGAQADDAAGAKDGK